MVLHVAANEYLIILYAYTIQSPVYTRAHHGSVGSQMSKESIDISQYLPLTGAGQLQLESNSALECLSNGFVCVYVGTGHELHICRYVGMYVYIPVSMLILWHLSG